MMNSIIYLSRSAAHLQMPETSCYHMIQHQYQKYSIIGFITSKQRYHMSKKVFLSPK